MQTKQRCLGDGQTVRLEHPVPRPPQGGAKFQRGTVGTGLERERAVPRERLRRQKVQGEKKEEVVIDSLRARQAGPLFIACGSYVDARPMAKRDRAARKIAADMVDQLDAKGLAECQPERTHERVEEGLGWFTSD